jgi:DNA repair protein RadC
MKAFYLNTANEIIGFYEVSSGSVAGTIADIRLILAPALLCGASGIILGHNHPSGNLAPSKADIDLTKKIKDAAKLLNTDLLDHIILTETSYSSFADEGLL